MQGVAMFHRVFLHAHNRCEQRIVCHRNHGFGAEPRIGQQMLGINARSLCPRNHGARHLWLGWTQRCAVANGNDCLCQLCGDMCRRINCGPVTLWEATRCFLSKIFGSTSELGGRDDLSDPVKFGVQFEFSPSEKDNLQERGQAPDTCPTVLEIGFEPASALHHHESNPTRHTGGIFSPKPACSLWLPRVLADFVDSAGAQNLALFALSEPLVSAAESTPPAPKSA